MQVLQEQCDVSLELAGALDINTADEMRGVCVGVSEATHRYRS